MNFTAPCEPDVTTLDINANKYPAQKKPLVTFD